MSATVPAHNSYAERCSADVIFVGIFQQFGDQVG
jgi:hypothetical protein